MEGPVKRTDNEICPLLLLLASASVYSSPFYFYSGIGAAGSPSRGLPVTTGHVGLGFEAYKAENFAVDLEAEYMEVGRSTGNVLTYNDIELNPVLEPPRQTKPAPPVPKIENQPIIRIDVPIPITLPTIPIPVVVETPEPEPQPEPKPEPVVAPCWEEVCPSSVPAANSSAPVVTQKMPTMQEGYYTLSVKPRWKVNRFLWLNFKFAAEKKILNGTITTKTGPTKGALRWTSSENVSNSIHRLSAGAGARAEFNNKLSGYLNLDYRETKAEVDGIEFLDNEYFVSTGLRFNF